MRLPLSFSRNTALAYLAASNFFDVLSEFGELDAEISSKLKYAKWRAGEISKAIREGRQPAPPPAAEIEQDTDAKLAQLDLLGVGLGAQAGAVGQEEKEYLEREMRKLEGDAGVDVPSAPAFSVDPGQGPTAISPDEGMDALSLAGAATAPRGGAPLTPNKGGRAHSRLSVDARSMNIGPFISPNAGEGAARLAPPDFAAQGLGSSPNFSKPMRSQLSRSGSGEDVEDAASTSPHLSPNLGHSRRSASEYVGSASNEGASEDVFGRRSLSPSLSGQPASRPSSAFLSFPSHQGPGPAGSGTPPSITPSAPPPSDLQSQATSSNIVSASNAIATPPAASAPAPAPPPTIALPQSLDASASAKVQKYAKWAASSMDHEDLDAARRFLRQALDILEGREVEEGKGKIKR
ncbi:Uncharacterized conserved protein [Ceraceosorus bombacis]|uniref:Uncharacterized conserved protein n=1 Tax=Ceraceosorus bombacis TaxID=401625 RepID=A0A0P1BEW6_9BASI|nr:Uncharacterized conserved protein [Ceraceosorus bombacis]